MVPTPNDRKESSRDLLEIIIRENHETKPNKIHVRTFKLWKSIVLFFQGLRMVYFTEILGKDKEWYVWEFVLKPICTYDSKFL